MEQLLIGGTALEKLGSNRYAKDLRYFINDESTEDLYIHEPGEKRTNVNANGHPFFKEVWKTLVNEDAIQEIASPQVLLELIAFDYVQHYQNGIWIKAYEAEFDIKFLAFKFRLEELKIARKYLEKREVEKVEKIMSSVIRDLNSPGPWERKLKSTGNKGTINYEDL